VASTSLLVISLGGLLLIRIYLVYGWAFRALTTHAYRIRGRIEADKYSSADEIVAEWQKFDQTVKPERLVLNLTVWSYKKAFPGY
jgi:hypothetical protein